MKVELSVDRPVLTPCTLESIDYQIDPYIGCAHYCYYCYALEDAETNWREEVLYHRDIGGRLKRELSEIPPQTIYMGWETDPYQPCEADCLQTRKALEVFRDKGFSASILTKSDLVLRDLDILQEMEDAAVSVSVAFNDNNTRKLFEANTIDTEARISALERLKRAGIKTSALICPVIPHITNVSRLLEMLAPVAERIWIYGLSISNRSDRNWKNVDGILESHFLALKKRIETAVFSRNDAYWVNLRRELSKIQRDRSLDLRIHV